MTTNTTPNNGITITTLPQTYSSNKTSSGAISGSSPFSLNDFSLDSLLNKTQRIRTHGKLSMHEMYESTQDLLVLSAASFRIKESTGIHYSIVDEDLYEKVNSDDVEQAELISDYYSKKLTFLKLNNDLEFTHYRQDLNSFIHSDRKRFKPTMIGLAYWLPIFYKYDKQIDHIKEEVNIKQGFKNMDKDNKPRTMNLSVDLKPINKVFRKTKRNCTFQYWFKDDKLNAGVMIEIEQKNQLIEVWNHIFETKELLTVEGYVSRKTLDNFEYFQLTNWKLKNI